MAIFFVIHLRPPKKSSFAIGGFTVTVLVQTNTSVIKFEPIKTYTIYEIKLLLN